MRRALRHRLLGAVLAILALVGVHAHAISGAMIVVPADDSQGLAGLSIVLCTADGRHVVDQSPGNPDGTDKTIPSAAHADLCCCSIVGGALPEMPTLYARTAWSSAAFPPAASLLERTGPPSAYRSRAPPVAAQA